MTIAATGAAQTDAQRQAVLLRAADGAAAGVSTSSPSAASTTQASAAGSAATQTNALSSLSSNFNDFLSLLTTQLQNQDPSSPLDTNQFTSELVQFANVSQQINTNQSLTKLIEVTQGGELLNAASLVGQKVTAQSGQLPLQDGTASLQFTATTPGPVAVAVYSAAGVKLTDAVVSATAGQNTWTWDGSTKSGTVAPDGAYNVAVEGLDASGTPVALPFNVIGTATSVQSDGTTVNLGLGSETLPLSSVRSIVK